MWVKQIKMGSRVTQYETGLEFYRGNCRRVRTKCHGSLRQRQQFFAT